MLSKQMVIGLAFVGVTLAFLLYWWLRTRAAEKANEAWGAVARFFGLSLRKEGVRMMEGEYEGVKIRVEVMMEVYSGGNVGRAGQVEFGFDGHATRYTVSYPGLGLGLKLSGEGRAASIPKAVGAQDIEVFERGFDSRCLIQGRDEEVVSCFLNPKRRVLIDRVFEVVESCTIDDEAIVHESSRVDRDPKIVMSKVFVMVRAAQGLIDPKETTGPIDEAFTRQEEQRSLDEAIERMNANTPVDENDAPRALR